MEYVDLGRRSDIQVSRIALGTWPFAGGRVWGDQDDDDSISAVHASLDSGITFFDSAEGYGRSEEVLGRGLKGRRHEAVIATKVSADNLGADDTRSACERSLQALQTDYIDLYQIHWPNWDVPLSATVGALEDLQAEGKIRAYGVCNFGKKDMSEVISLGQCVTNQMPYNLVWRVIERAVLPLCRQNGVGIICYSPLAQGILTGRFATADDVPEGIARTRHFSSERPLAIHGEPGLEGALFEAVAKMRGIAADLGQPMAAVALAWLRHQEGITSLLVGARNAGEVQRNLPAAQLTLSEDVLRQLSEVTEPVKEGLGTNLEFWQVPSRMR